MESVLSQTFEHYEVILIDDGSPDNAGKICDEYAEKENRVRVVHQENQGLAIARKNGVNCASGKYVMFLDSDDWIDRDMFAEMQDMIYRNNADIVCSQFRRVDSKGRVISKEKNFPAIVCDKTEDMIYHMHVTRYLSTAAPTKLIKKELMESVSFSGSLAIGEEHDMVTQLVLKAHRTVIVDNVYYNYFTRDNSISHSGYNSKYSNSLDKYIRIEKDLEKKFPQYRIPLRGFYAEYEMAVITAMCRNKRFDWDVIRRLQETLQEHLPDICRNKPTAFYMKCCAVMITYTPKLFCNCFILINKYTNRKEIK